jgi:ABC-type antimicrobial peptide transport system permease subunit
MADIVRESMGLWAISSLFLGMFGLVALGLAALGIYGVVAFSVSQRQKEMGLRLALGAGRRRIVRGVVREGIAVTAVGLGVGTVGALGAGILLSNLLLGVGSVDVPTLLAVTVVFLIVSVLSAAIPARRAAMVEPSEALRQD